MCTVNVLATFKIVSQTLFILLHQTSACGMNLHIDWMWCRTINRSHIELQKAGRFYHLVKIKHFYLLLLLSSDYEPRPMSGLLLLLHNSLSTLYNCIFYVESYTGAYSFTNVFYYFILSIAFTMRVRQDIYGQYIVLQILL